MQYFLQSNNLYFIAKFDVIKILTMKLLSYKQLNIDDKLGFERN